MKRFARAVLFLAVVLAAPLLRAEVKLPAIISDNMALQAGMEAPVWGWADPDEKVTVCIAGHSKSTRACCDGKWSLKLKKMCPGGPYEMTVSTKANSITVRNVLVGEVWVCSGQSNMEFTTSSALNFPAEKEAARHPTIRLFTVKKSVQDQPVADCEGKWLECSPETVGSFSAVGYFFGRKLSEELHVPVGLIHTSWGGTVAEAWTTRATLTGNPELKPIMDRFEKSRAEDTPAAWDKKMAAYKDAQEKFKGTLEKWKADVEKAKAAKQELPKQPQGPRPPQHALNQNSPAALYNGMIAPIVPYGIAGATWYQGESNAGRAYQYRTLLPEMIHDWRMAWGQCDFPFMIVQLANFMARKPEPGDSAWAELREAQTLTAIHGHNVGQGLAIDIGDATDIHPKNKQDVGLRLALQALKITYHRDIAFSGPMYDFYSMGNGSMRIHFKHVFGGLEAKGGELKGFAIAGEDKKFVWATAKIEGDTVVVSSDKVAKPVAVRYAWADNPECNLYNKANLPAVPFRTDTWPGVTAGKP